MRLKKQISMILLFFVTSVFVSFCKIQNVTANQKIPENAIPATVKIISFNLTANNHVLEKVIASGTVISKDGLILTNHHVVTDENEENYEAFAVCFVTDKNKKPDCLNTASVIAKDKSLDIALLKIKNVDIDNKSIPEFNFLNWETDSQPKIDTKISLTGFPNIGGKTITSTEGQISGFDEKENIKFIKTDATIDEGNSGGTATDAHGNLIGVPSYMRSNYSTMGYVIPLYAIQNFIRDNIEKTPQENEIAVSLLNKLLQKKYEAEKNQKYISSVFPNYELKIPDKWEIEFINDSNITLSNTFKGQDMVFSITITQTAFDLTDDAIQIILEVMEKNKHTMKNYNRKEMELQGIKGYLMNFDSNNLRYYMFLGYLENSLVIYNYAIPLDNLEESATEISGLLSSLTILKTKNSYPKYLQEYSDEYININLKTFDDFYITKIQDSEQEDMIADIDNPNSLKQEMYIMDMYFSKDYWELERKEIFEKQIKKIISRYELMNKYENITIDGLNGFAYTYRHTGDEYNETLKTTDIFLIKNNKKYFYITYTDLEEKYNENLSKFIKTLNNFEYNGQENISSKGKYEIPSFRDIYSDIKYHYYEQEITVLSSYDIINFPNKNFYPEKPIDKMSALKAILNSKAFVEKGRNINTTAQEMEKIENENQLIEYATKKGIIKSDFNPRGTITIAEAMEILCKTYELRVWNPPYKINQQLPYFYKAQLMGIIYESIPMDQTLSRGQFAGLLYHFIRVAGERYDF